MLACLDELKKLPVELLTPAEPEHIAGILAFRHPAAERINDYLHSQNVHVMSHAGRLRVAIHGYNSPADVERLIEGLRSALRRLESGADQPHGDFEPRSFEHG